MQRGIPSQTPKAIYSTVTKTVFTREKAGPGTSLWDRASRYSFTKARISRKSLARFCQEMSTDEYTLVVHSRDVDHRRFFPNSFVVDKGSDRPADLHTDRYYEGLRELDDESFPVVLCTGLLEHVPHPNRLIQQFHRVLEPGGRLIITGSAVFPFHGAPDNFFHFTPNGFRLLFRDWSHFDMLRGSSAPFETIAILLQRINLQCDVFPPVRPLIEMLYHVIPVLDRFVIRQYDSFVHRNDPGAATRFFMPAALYAVVVK